MGTMTQGPSRTHGASRNILKGAWGIVLAVVAVLVLAGGAFAVGRTTAAPSTSTPTSTGQHQAAHGSGGGPTVQWAQAHHDQVAWMQHHPGQWQWMQQHPGQWQWMQHYPGQWRWWMSATPAQRAWMGAHRGDIAWMHDHWNTWHQWRDQHGTSQGSGSGSSGSQHGDWCGNGWMCH